MNRPFSFQVAIERTSFRKLMIAGVIGIVLIFLLVGFLTSFEAKYRLQSSSIHQWITSFSGESLVYVMGMENAYFTQVLSKESEPPSLSKVAFELATSVTPGDIRSLLGRELPGFALYDANILVAGEGTDFTNLPIESAPPMEVLMAEREATVENLEGLETDENKIPTPALTTNGKKVVYIYHTHSWESYFPLLKDIDTSDANQATDSKTNITLIGEKFGKELEKRGIGVEVNKTNMGEELHKKGWNSSRAYSASRPIVQSAMANNQDLKFFFDLHRDSLRKDKTTVTINNKAYAKTVFVIGEENGNYQENLKMANMLHTLIDEKYPGLSRGIIGKQGKGVNGVYNQDLSPNSLVIEIGGVDNTIEELSRTAEALAEVISDYYWQAEKVNN
ncbi:stage II sporulation protein P [Bacillus taeanensis]|uniref:Stage II sporulation protein P n=1 Tax=Bacillus taeanensis TaxID=273032 RepID=A0A366XVS1_9BACI|nr:stage II sporulation protein P [Bacillus taeanensis]RBW70490.1 stage II sporulation protein P [Bacillus taeanensis]